MFNHNHVCYFPLSLETEVDQFEKFERDATALESWLDTAENRIAVISSGPDLNPSNPRSLLMIQERMLDLATLRADADRQQQTLRARVSVTAAQLLRQRPRDDDIHARAHALDQRWISLMFKVRLREGKYKCKGFVSVCVSFVYGVHRAYCHLLLCDFVVV